MNLGWYYVTYWGAGFPIFRMLSNCEVRFGSLGCGGCGPLPITSKRLLEVSSKSPMIAGFDGSASISSKLISLTGSGYFTSYFLSFSSSSLLSSFLAEIPENSADFIFSFFSSTIGFSGSFFLVLVVLSLLVWIVVPLVGFDLSSSDSGAFWPQTCLLFVTLSYKLSLVSDELYVTLTGANPEVLSTGAAELLFTSLVRLRIGYYYS